MENKIIPTAEEVIDKMVKFASVNDTINCTVYSLSQVMIEFAKMHVESALKEASEVATINKNKGQVTGREFGNVTDGSYSINQPSILNSYSLDNIK